MEKELRRVPCNNMDELRKHDVEPTKPDIKETLRTIPFTYCSRQTILNKGA